MQGIENIKQAVDVLVAVAPDAIQLTLGQAHYLQAIPGREKPSLVLRTDVANVYGKQLPRTLFSRMIENPVEQAIRLDAACVVVNLFSIPDEPEVTDQCIQNILKIKPETERYGINLANEPEYCEKLMYAWEGQTTPAHYHKQKKEDIICRVGALSVTLWAKDPDVADQGYVAVKVNGAYQQVRGGDTLILHAGERITITPFLWHAFYPSSTECIIGEVSTANDDVNDNFFWDKNIGRYPEVVEDEAPLVKLLSDN